MESTPSSKSSMKEYFSKMKNDYNTSTISTAYSNLWKSEYISLPLGNKKDEKFLLVEVEIIYKEENLDEKENKNYKTGFFNNVAEVDPHDDSKNYVQMESYKHTARFYIPSSRVTGTFIEQELLKNGNTDQNYIKIELRAKRNKVLLETILNCFEFLLDKNFDFHFNKENLISYFYAFSLCQLQDKRREVLEKLLQDLTDDNIVYFLKVVSALDDDFLYSYSFWLLRYLINNNEGLNQISFNGYNYSNIVKLSYGVNYQFDDNSISFRKLNASVSANLNFLKKYFDKYKADMNKYFKVNDYFNMGKVLRRKSEDNLVDDYPHYYQLVLENDPSIVLYAVRPSENGNFILSRSIDDFSKHGINYLAEVVPNFWGTYFDVYDYGFEKSLYDRTPKVLSKEREKIGSIHYETNIMGECPRYFKLDINHNKEVHHLENLKPEWNEEMDCFCLNFYGRVKKASAKNFQICYPEDQDNIILQHGKVNKDEFNIDFREPFNFVFAFAVSLVAIGKKRVVS